MDIEWQVVAMSLNQKWRIWMRIDGNLTAVQVQHVATSAVCRYGYKWHYTDAQRESMLQRMLKRCNTYTDHIDYLFGREVQ